MAATGFPAMEDVKLQAQKRTTPEWVNALRSCLGDLSGKDIVESKGSYITRILTNESGWNSLHLGDADPKKASAHKLKFESINVYKREWKDMMKLVIENEKGVVLIPVEITDNVSEVIRFLTQSKCKCRWVLFTRSSRVETLCKELHVVLQDSQSPLFVFSNVQTPKRLGCG